MSNFMDRISTVLKRPRIGVEFAHWVFQEKLLAREPIRQIHGVSLSGFNGFSEYHTTARGITSDERSFIESYPLGDGVIFDVGANLGLFSFSIASQFDEHYVYAIEPNPSTFLCLQKNIKRNEKQKILGFQLAIADHDGFVQFSSREHARANASIARENKAASDTVSVPCLTLDSFCHHNSVDKIAMLKIDVEGYETLVLGGGVNVLKTTRPPLIYFEVCPALTRSAGFDPTQPSNTLARYGYQLNRIGCNGKLIPVTPDQAASVECVENWVAVLPQ